MNTNLADRRVLVRRQFYEGLVSKVAIGDPAAALTKLLKAYHLARDPLPLPGVWPSVTAYRLAHLLFRDCSGEADLLEVKRLLTEILEDANCPADLTIRSSIMRVAVLQRLHYSSPGRFRLEEAEHELNRAIRCRNAHYDVLASSRPRDASPVQEPLLNLIELAGYFIGGNLKSLQNRGVIPELLPNTNRQGLWYIVGNEGRSSDLIYSEALATTEVEALIAHREVDIAFRVEKKSAEMLLPKIAVRKRRGGAPSIPNAAYKAMALACVSQDPDTWQARFSGFGVNALLTRKALCHALDIDEKSNSDLFACPRYDGVYRFRPDLRVVAMIAADCVDGWSHLLRDG